MGIFGSLFGKSGKDDDQADRCNDCGMAGGRHTDWCPTAEGARESVPADAPAEGSGPPDQGGREVQPGA